jgi:hypothetical protein
MSLIGDPHYVSVDLKSIQSCGLLASTASLSYNTWSIVSQSLEPTHMGLSTIPIRPRWLTATYGTFFVIKLSKPKLDFANRVYCTVCKSNLNLSSGIIANKNNRSYIEATTRDFCMGRCCRGNCKPRHKIWQIPDKKK